MKPNTMTPTWRKLTLALALAGTGLPALAGNSLSIQQLGNGPNQASVEQADNVVASATISQTGANRLGDAGSQAFGVVQRANVSATLGITQIGSSAAEVRQEEGTAANFLLTQDGANLTFLGLQKDVAQSDVDAGQLGQKNTLRIEQEEVGKSTILARQDGSDSFLKIVQYEVANTQAEVAQKGVRNEFLLVQQYLDTSSALLRQDGADNRMQISQASGEKLDAQLVQRGTDQLTVLTQGGSSNRVSTDQSGKWNELNLLQAGNNNAMRLTQQGSGTDAATRNRIRADQAGVGAVLIVGQSGVAQSAVVRQR